jgi:hypothetical protein
MPLSRTQCLSFGSYCAPLCAPESLNVHLLELCASFRACSIRGCLADQNLAENAPLLLPQSRDRRYQLPRAASLTPNSHNFARVERPGLLLPTDDIYPAAKIPPHAEHEILIFL